MIAAEKNGEPYLKEMYRAAGEAMANAHAPYSQFPVGAAIRTPSGKIYAGCNIENAAYPQGWCAETSAIAHMVTAGEREIAEILVVAEKQIKATPCGGCRQRIAEFATAATPVHLCDHAGVIETVTLADLLPRSFSLDAG